MAIRLPALRPDRYEVVRPPSALAHRAGHVWEQVLLPARAGRAVLYSPANLAPAVYPRNAVVIHDAAALRHPEAYSPGYVAYQRRMLPLLARRALVLITVSEFSRGELVEMLGADPDRVRVIPEGVDARFSAARPVPALVARYGLTGPYVLALGTASHRKNLDALAPAAAALKSRGMELVVAGSERGYLRGAIPHPWLRRLGYVPDEDLPALYAGARALAMPSRYEGFGLPCLEAMAAGTPVVCANRGALPETVGDAGVLVDPDDADGFADALVRVVTDAVLHDKLVRAGRSQVSRFSWADCARLTDAAIAEVLPEL